MLVPRRVRWRTFNFQTIIHQKLVEFPVLVIRAQRQFRVLYLRVSGIDPNSEKLQFACYFCAAFDEIFLLCSSPGGIIRASRRQCYPCFKCSADFGFSDSVRQSRQIRFLCLSCCSPFIFVSGRKKTATAKRQLRSYESILSFHVLRAEPGAYLSPSLHLRPEIAPPLICSDLEYRSILAH